MNMRTLVLVTIGLTACASNSGVIPMGRDNFMVSRQAGSGFTGSGTLKADAIKEATEFCGRSGRSLQVDKVQEAQPPYIFGNFPKAEVEFQCLKPGEREVAGAKAAPIPVTQSK